MLWTKAQCKGNRNNEYTWPYSHLPADVKMKNFINNMLAVPPFLVYHDVDNKHRWWTTPLVSTFTGPHPDCSINITNKEDRWVNQVVVTHKLSQSTVWKGSSEAELHHPFLSPHIYPVTTGLKVKLTSRSRSPITESTKKLDYLAAIRGQKWGPLIALSSYSKFIYPCCITTQHSHVQLSANNGPLLWEQTELLRGALVSPTEWITKLSDRDSGLFLAFLIISQTADRTGAVGFFWWQMAHLGSLIFLWYDEQSQGDAFINFKRETGNICLTVAYNLQIVRKSLNCQHKYKRAEIICWRTKGFISVIFNQNVQHLSAIRLFNLIIFSHIW